MKFFSTLAFLIAIVSVSAKKHRFCCCRNATSCDSKSTQKIVDATGGRWEIINYSWNGEGCPFKGYNNWAHANVKPDDGTIGGDEMQKACKPYGKASICFTPH
ncbi:hypothetical protein FKW77_008133 [Venturia effusa]|uniref:Uncharacterized protein n=1 Tax=Venturia effusa TaxID=50376 RepID=A0A517KWX9_9PEZI|nr:hypothetical protein FKW77_008133 [Venturia effusa]